MTEVLDTRASTISVVFWQGGTRPMAARAAYAAELPPQRLREYGTWSEQVSSTGHVYYYNRQTEVSQWYKPSGWEQAEIMFALHLKTQKEQEAAIAAESGSDMDVSSPDCMDLSYGNSPAPSPSSPTEDELVKPVEEFDRLRPSSGQHDYEDDIETSNHGGESSEKKEPEYEKGYEYRKYLKPDLVLDLRQKLLMQGYSAMSLDMVLGEVTTDIKPEISDYQKNICDSVKYEFMYTELKTETLRARSLARTSMFEATILQRRVQSLQQQREYLEANRQYLHAKFESEMPRILLGKRRNPGEGPPLDAIVYDSTDTRDVVVTKEEVEVDEHEKSVEADSSITSPSKCDTSSDQPSSADSDVPSFSSPLESYDSTCCSSSFLQDFTVA